MFFHIQSEQDRESLLDGRIDYCDEKPVVIGYVRTDYHNVTAKNTIEQQREEIGSQCYRRFSEGYHLIYVVESEENPEGSSRFARRVSCLDECGEGLQHVMFLLRKKKVRCLCVAYMDRISKKVSTQYAFMQHVIYPFGALLLIADGDEIIGDSELLRRPFSESVSRIITETEVGEQAKSDSGAGD